jgi:hypothetical protein
MRDATAVTEKQHRAIAALNQKVSHLQALVDQSPHTAKAIARDPDLLLRTVDLLLAEPALEAATALSKPIRRGRFSTQHGGNVLAAVRSDN